MPRDRSKDIEILDMPLPVAVVAFLSAVGLIFLVLKALISYRLVFSIMSMEPTAHLLDWAVVDRHAYSGHPPRRGDIIMTRGFHDLPLVLRVIGEPGEWVKSSSDGIAIGGTPFDRRCRKLDLPPQPLAQREDADADLVRVLRESGVPADTAPELICLEAWPHIDRFETLVWSGGAPELRDVSFIVPHRRYFVVGDNRTGGAMSLLAMRYSDTHRARDAPEPAFRMTVAQTEIAGKVLFFVPSTKHFFCPAMEKQSTALRPESPCILLKRLEELPPWPDLD